MKKLIGVLLAAIVFSASIHESGIQVQAEDLEEEKKDIKECTVVESLGERPYKVPYQDTYKQGTIRILPSQRYTGSAIEPKVTIMDGDYKLVEGKDYKLYYEDTRKTDLSSPVEPYCGSFLNEYGNEEGPLVDVYGMGDYSGNIFFCFAILSENQKETENHLIYSDKEVLAGYDGLTIDGYVGVGTEVDIPLSIDEKPVQEINKRAFAYNPTLEKLNVSDNVFRILDSAFFRCRNLKEVTLSKQLWGIGTAAFAGCTSLKNISLPKSLEMVGGYVFLGNRAMEAVYSESNVIYAVDGVMFVRNGGLSHRTNALYFYPPAKKGETYCIPNGIQELDSCSFRQADYVKNVIIPQSVSDVAQAVDCPFGGATNLVGAGAEETSTNAVNIIFKHDTPTEYILGSRAPFSYTLPAGSMITVKNEAMKKAAELSVTDEFRENVTVRVAAKASEGFELAKKEITLSKRGAEQLEWSQMPADTTENVSWESSDKSVADVDAVQGKVTAEGYGKCEIIGVDESGHRREAEVFVYDPCSRSSFMLDYDTKGQIFKKDDRYPDGVCVIPEMTNGKKEGSFILGEDKFHVAVAFADGYAGAMPIRFESSAEDVASVEDVHEGTFVTGVPTGEEGYFQENNKYAKAYIYFHNPGTATITAVFDDHGKEIREDLTVNVKGSSVNLPEPVKKDQELLYKKTFQKPFGSKPFLLNVKRKKGDGEIRYDSSDKKIATVSQNGKVTVKDTGRTVITATAKGTEKYKKKSVKITLDITPKKQIASVKLVKGKKMTVKWKKDKRATGYQVQYSADKNFKKGVKTKDVSRYDTTSKIITGLKKGKVYYVRVRAYKDVKAGAKIKELCGPWSASAKSKKIV